VPVKDSDVSCAPVPAALLHFDDESAEAIAVAIADEIDRNVDYRPVETDGAACAAALIAELV